MQEYNCNGSIDSSYGAGAYSSCTASVGAPNTGLESILSSGALGILLPLAGLVVLLTIATLVVRHRKKRA